MIDAIIDEEFLSMCEVASAKLHDAARAIIDSPTGAALEDIKRYLDHRAIYNYTCLEYMQSVMRDYRREKEGGLNG